MDRFVAMVWNPDERTFLWQINAWSNALQHASPRWLCILEAPGLRVFSMQQRGDAPVIAPWTGADGVVIGPIFARGHERHGRVTRLEAGETNRALKSRGKSLIEDFWGRYVALWRDTDTRSTYVLRDPCGGVPCFMTKHNNLTLLFSHADDVAHLPSLNFTIDWTYLHAFILFNYFVTKFTGLKEVTELLGGERMRWRASAEPHFEFVWNGADVARRPRFQSFNDAKAELRDVTEASFTAWGTEYRNVVVSLSGGLDSAILVNLLRRVSSAKITGLHYLGLGYEQYEAKLARLAARHAEVELVEASQDPSEDDVSRILTAPRIARPKLQSISVLVDRIASDLADKVGADAFMVGQGGDNLFLQRGCANFTLTDYIRLNGPGGDFWRVAYDASMLQRSSVWKAMGDSFQDAFLHPQDDLFAFLESSEGTKHRPLVANAVKAIPQNYKHHPWLIDRSGLPRGKAEHLVNVVGLYNYYIHHGRGIARDVVYPYVSQPIAEHVLRTPTYLLCQGGLDRAMERSAFADLIPEEVARRTSKGGANHYLLRVMRRNIDLYREVILDGAIINLGWLDRQKIERMLASDYAVAGGGASFVYQLFVAEAWLQSWRGDTLHAAEA